MANPFTADTFSLPGKTNKAEKAISVGIHFLLYAIIFLGGYIFAKIQTLLMGL